MDLRTDLKTGIAFTSFSKTSISPYSRYYYKNCRGFNLNDMNNPFNVFNPKTGKETTSSTQFFFDFSTKLMLPTLDYLELGDAFRPFLSFYSYANYENSVKKLFFIFLYSF